MDERRTEVDGWLAEWRIDQHRIRMLLVRNGSEEPLVSFSVASAPDLVQLRERFPRLSRLWDSIRHEYWAEFAPSPRYSRGRFISVDDDRRLRLVPTDPTPARIRQLTARAGRAGYRVVRGPVAPYEWQLIDAEDGVTSYSAVDLEQIEQWLNE